jgi:folate-binding protein YgfZ
MNHPPIPPLPAETLVLDGSDALAFAHAQFGSDLHALGIGAWQWSTWLDPQGRVRALLQIARTGEQRLLLLLRGGRAQPLAEALRRYVFRSHVAIEAQAPRALSDAAPAPEGSMTGSGDDIVLGCGDYGLHIAAAAGGTANSDGQAWRWPAIRAGHPWLPDAALDTLLPPALSLERLGAVSFAKGCFPGQEIAARLHYRGGNKRHLYRVGAGARLVPGTQVLALGESTGLLLDCASSGNGHEALAVLRGDADDGPLQAGGAALAVLERFPD